ncbi:hypothetical protein [Arthrobacter sp. UYCo732]|uniref:hypothetical protein n=1 Tax=Arthrobacter sp. UYCo732 TaxID=3156336 RepID=UPI003396F58B
MTDDSDDMAPIMLWTGGGRSLRLYRPLTPEQCLVRDVRRGGFPLLRKETCRADQRCWTGVHTYLKTLVGQQVADLIQPRPVARRAATA